MQRRLALALAACSALASAVVGGGGAAAADLDHLVFVPNKDSADVALIDTRTDEVVTKVAVGTTPHQVAVSKVLNLLVATNSGSDTISVVDLDRPGQATTIALGHVPEHMELDPSGRLLAVANIEAGSVSLVDLERRLETARIEGFHAPHNLTFAANGKLLYVANLGADTVSVVDVATARIVNEIGLAEPRQVASTTADVDFQGVVNVTPTPDGRLGFAAYGSGDGLAVIDLETQDVVKRLTLGSTPWRAYATGDGRRMIVPNNGDATVSIVDTATLAEVARVAGAAEMTGVNTGWFETTAFVLSRGERKAVILDLERNDRAGEIALPGTPETGVTTPDGTKLYVALSDADAVAVIDTRARRLLKVIDGVGHGPWGAHMMGAANYCH
ncbi:beta-propeller fold lactonase family protein [Benzoatithermus flavus]|uniref:Beta-propeller fold lactonase family protein n=1 Tax=Benzoatithermus flavus TaxID=3108223 RepID=A0ABU8XVR8_9PROT